MNIQKRGTGKLEHAPGSWVGPPQHRHCSQPNYSPALITVLFKISGCHDIGFSILVTTVSENLKRIKLAPKVLRSDHRNNEEAIS